MLEVIFYFYHRMPGTSSHTYQGSRGKTARILKGVLHTIRDRMPLIEAMDALAQMPLFMKGIFVDQWKYHEKTEKIRSKQQFNEAVRQRPEIVEFSDFPNDEDVINTTRDLISLMSEHIDEGQMHHIKANMPGEMHPVLDEAMC
jgi:uncharacterized protein (DUF2267 family)